MVHLLSDRHAAQVPCQSAVVQVFRATARLVSCSPFVVFSTETIDIMGPLLPFHERQHAEYLNYRPDPFRLFLMSFPGGLILQANVACDIFRMRQYAGLTLSQECYDTRDCPLSQMSIGTDISRGFSEKNVRACARVFWRGGICRDRGSAMAGQWAIVEKD